MPISLESWLLGYALHSTLLLASVWLLARALPSLPLALEERLWKLALVGGLATATLQPLLAFVPLGGVLELAAATGADSLTPLEATAPAALAAEAGPATVQAGALTTSTLAWRDWALAAWAVIGLGLLVRLGWLKLRLARRLGARRDVAEQQIVGLLERLRRRAGARRRVRLSVCESIAVPVALGTLRAEVCLPRRALRELDRDALETIMAHELAHHLRGDPMWLLLTRTLQAVFFFQPLHWLAGRRLVELSELASDAHAVRLTRKPLALASGLTRVAEWSRLGPLLSLAPRLAARRSGLARRVERLLERRTWERERTPLWTAPLLLGVLALTVAAAPAVSNGPLSRLPAGEPEPIVIVAQIEAPARVEETVEVEVEEEVVVEPDIEISSENEDLRRELRASSDEVADAAERIVDAQRRIKVAVERAVRQAREAIEQGRFERDEELVERVRVEVARAVKEWREAHSRAQQEIQRSVRELYRRNSERQLEIEVWREELNEQIREIEKLSKEG